MRQQSFTLRAALAAALCAASLGAGAQDLGDRTTSPAVARQQKAEIAKGDPARWYRGDRTDKARLNIQKKEIAAAYTEAKNACHKAASGERAGCLKQARATYQRDMANAPALVAQAPTAEVSERVVTVYTQPSEAGAGAAQVGGSQSGTATGSGGMQDDQSGMGQSGAGQSGAGQEGTGQSGMGQSGMGQQGTGQSGNSQSGTSQSGTSQSGTSQSGTSNSDTPQSDVPRR